MTADALLPLSVAVPLAGALVALAGGARHAPAVGLAASLASAATGLGAAFAAWQTDGLSQSLGGWPPPLGIRLAADALAALMLGMTAIVGLGASLYARGYFGRGEAERAARFWPLWLTLWAALAAVFVSADLFNIYVALELVTLAGVGLVALAGGAALTSALSYLVWALAGSAFYLAGVALIYGAAGTLALDGLAAALAPAPAPRFGAALVLAGLALKGALFPLHIWLPRAHAEAPAPVSAVLSALVVKTSFYLVIRLADGAFAPLAGGAALALLGWLGAGAILWGSALALVQRRLKLLVAYSTVAQLGYLYLALGLAAPAPALYLAGSHALAKAAMFLSAGAVMHRVGHDELAALGGIAHRMPIALFAFGIAGVSIIGLPPSGGFVGKWLLLEHALGAGHWTAAALVVAGGLAAAAYVFRVVGPCFAPSEVQRDPPSSGELVAFALALAALALGFLAPWLLAPFGPGAPA